MGDGEPISWETRGCFGLWVWGFRGFGVSGLWFGV